jgi:hypothetical protein
MSTKELKTLCALAKEDQLDFSPEFLRIYTKHRASSKNQIQSDITKYLGDKLAKKLNISSIKVPWSHIKTGDIVNWPSDVKLIPISQLSSKDVNSLYALAKEDLLDFSPTFLRRLRVHQLRKSKSRTPEFQEIISDIQTALCNKLNDGTNKKFKKVPWIMLKTDDIINWPAGIPFIRLSRHTMNRLKLLHKLRYEIFFSEEFLKKLSDPRYEWTLARYI